jgi:8-oxo-dGTP diphosphatase
MRRSTQGRDRASGRASRVIRRLRNHRGVHALRVIGAVIVRDGRLLLVSKIAAPSIYYLPGGKPAAGESAETCLSRELREELGVQAHALRHYAEVRAPAALEPVALHMTVYRAEIRGVPSPACEIASIVWWPEPTPVTLAPAVAHEVVPLLRSERVLVADPAAAGQRTTTTERLTLPRGSGAFVRMGAVGFEPTASRV